MLKKLTLLILIISSSLITTWLITHSLAAAPIGGQRSAVGGQYLHYKSKLGLMPPAYTINSLKTHPLNKPPTTIPFLSAYNSVAVGSWPQVIALSDLTGDTQPDAAIGTATYFNPSNDAQLHLFSNQGGGIFSHTNQYPAGSYPAAIQALDFNNDNRTDIALALSTDNTLNLYQQTITPGLTAPITLTVQGGPNALAAGDFTGNRQLDLAIIKPLSSSIALWASHTQTWLPITLPYPTSGFDALATGDLDNNGTDDLVALRGAGYITNAIVIYWHTNASFPLSTTLSPQTGGFLPHSVAVGDVNTDGLDDIVVTAGGNSDVAYLNIFLQTAQGLTTTPITYPAYHLPSALAIADINHDGRNDIIVLHDAWQTLSVYTQTISHTLAAYATAPLPYSDRYLPDALALSDLDANNSLDIAVVDRGNGLSTLLNTLTAPTANINQPPPGALLTPGIYTATGSSSNAITVQVRLKGGTDWLTTTPISNSWHISLTLPAQERNWLLEARAIDAQGHIQYPPAQHRLGIEAGPPIGQLLINNGDPTTNSPTVTLTLLAYDNSSVSKMRFSLDTIFYTDWLTYSLTHTWVFDPPTDGLKTLYVQYQDTLNNNSNPIPADILLDTVPPTSIINSLPTTTTQSTITLSWVGSDATSSIAFYNIQFKDTADDIWLDLLTHATITHTLFQGQNHHQYCFRSQAIDLAANSEAWPTGDGDTCLTFNLDYGLSLSPPLATLIGQPGTSQTYTFLIQNTGNTNADYSLLLSASTWNSTISSPQIGPLAPNETTNFNITVTIPLTATNFDTDTITVTVINQNNPSTLETARLTTIASTEIVTPNGALFPATASKADNPAKVTTYTLYVQNTGNFTDSYNLQVGTSAWDTSLSTDSITALAPGALAIINAYVSIPSNTLNLDSDTVDISVHSHFGLDIQDSSTLSTIATTQAISRGLNLSPATLANSTLINRTINYTVFITNTGTVLDAITFIPFNNNWPTQITPAGVSLQSSQQEKVTVTVSVPATAFHGQQDTVTILAIGTTVSKSITITTTAIIMETTFVYLPLVIK